jgi:hypothetical protein
MASKTLATLLIIFCCIIFFPIAIGIAGGLFGVIVGLCGAIFGIIAGMFGALFGVIGSLFGGIFHWHHNFHWNVFTMALVVILIVIISKSHKNNSKR